MQLKLQKPKQSINKAYLKEKVNRADIEVFKTNFNDFLEKINHIGDEEHLKSLIADFFKFTWYKDAFQINPIGKNDLVIHTGKSTNDSIGVIIEVKSLVNKTEMISDKRANAKAFHELVLYYLHERIVNNRHDIKQLIATNIQEWFIFDANEFDKKIYRNTAIKKLFEQKRNDHKDNPWFYDELKKLLELSSSAFEVTYFDLFSYKKLSSDSDSDNDKYLIPLFKIFSPVHLLKIPFANDSNSLQPKFYTELLHIIGLHEYDGGSKKLIGRKKDEERNAGSLLENTITNLDSHDKINRLDKPSLFGDNYQDRLYNVALELVITWVNRILFLKLLEAQLLNYHKNDSVYNFLNYSRIRDFDDLDKLFFRVLAKRADERSADVLKAFSKVPYLNSSLFEPTELEHQTFFISALEDSLPLALIKGTVLKDSNGKIKNGQLNAIEYLFDFLNAYDFSSEGAVDIQEDNKPLINASVLGLIFEKINGYKEGSFFTPGHVTMQMAREAIRSTIVAKFNEIKSWSITDYHQLYDLITDKAEANDIINSIRICDPAVGSGHFLVSALNELIAIKSDLNILMSGDGRTLRDYTIEVVNDELIITDENNDPFKYHYKDSRSQTVQETLFHEKQILIENCLFGVDINPNSVKICRLRLWIELLKNAYYKPKGDSRLAEPELETLPNIDINIKVGNSLVSRFSLGADLRAALKKNKITIQAYRKAVDTYRNAKDKVEKREMEQIINSIKNNFKSEISASSKELKDLQKLENEYLYKYDTTQLFAQRLTKKQQKDKGDLRLKVDAAKNLVEDIKNNKIYENAFEWRFEFPEVLDNEGDFQGFDVIIGNPPYGAQVTQDFKKYVKSRYVTHQYKYDTYTYFMEHGLSLLHKSGFLSFITPTLWLSLESNYRLRRLVVQSNNLLSIDIFGENVFEEAVVNTCSYLLQKGSPRPSLTINNKGTVYEMAKSHINEHRNLVISYSLNDLERSIIKKIEDQSVFLSQFGDVIQGITSYDAYSGQDKETIKNKAYHSKTPKDSTYVQWLDGKDVNRNVIKWGGNWVSYGPWLAAPREKRFFEGKRLLFREVPGQNKRIQAALTEDDFYYGHSISPFKPISEQVKNLEYFLGIVNSKLISWYGGRVLSNFGKDVFPKLNPNDIKELPIPKKFLFENELITLVKTLIASPSDPVIDKEIDQLIYKIYGITNEEVAHIETQFS